MRRRLGVSMVGLVFVGVMSTSLAVAQSDGGKVSSRRPRGTLSIFTIVRAEPIQEELGLTDDQKTKLSDLLLEFDDSLIEIQERTPPNLGDLSSDERNKVLTALDEHARKVTEQKKPALAAILSAEQLARANQISLQKVGGHALFEKEVSEKLKITADQAKKLDEISDKFAEKLDDVAFARNGGNLQHRREKGRVLSKQRDTDMFAVLTPTQASQFRAMKGKDFDLKLLER